MNVYERYGDKLLGRKHISVCLTQSAHVAIKTACFRRKLSMQEVFEEFAQRVAAEDPNVIAILDGVSDAKREKKLRKLETADREQIYEMLGKVQDALEDRI